jgi:hypothetical protein
LVALTSNQVQAITTSGVGALTTTQVAALTTAQVVALTSSQVQALTTAQVAALTTAQIAVMETADVAALKTTQVVALTTADVAALTTAQVVALTSVQIAALTTGQVAALTTAQVVSIQTADVVALRTSQIQALTTANVAVLTTAQIAHLTTAQVAALTTTQTAAFTTSQGTVLGLGTPIVLDLNGDGVKTKSIADGVSFDLFATGTKVSTGWVSSSDGLLVMDRNGDGQINDGSELFGSSTTLANGQKAVDGYQALRELDTNGDGTIDKNDAAFANLRVWIDANSDGISEKGEVVGLDSLGITSISANATVTPTKDNGNLIGLTSTFDINGKTQEAADVWFVADKAAAYAATPQTLAPAPASSPQPGVPTVTAAAPIALDWNVPLAPAGSAPAGSPPVTAAATPLPAPSPQVVAGQSDLRTQVSSIAQAISAFAGDANAGTAETPKLNVASASSGGAALTAVSMADVLKQFDANGNLLLPQGTAANGLNGVPSLVPTQDPNSDGALASATPKPTGS